MQIQLIPYFNVQFKDSKDPPWLHEEICEESLQPSKPAKNKSFSGERVEKEQCETGTNLVGVLTGGWNTDGAGPVVVEVGQLVGELLEVLG